MVNKIQEKSFWLRLASALASWYATCSMPNKQNNFS